ncbi:YkvA family protein [Pedobacter sandarakinus]|uniref:YkvA family protein n=1 Tax=Pedobacter sandarakinus TaxID=353156 RepID=UPI0022460B82|nr:YkvA family protein [Pedobacter sandarakinus]MCX2576242.1 YkvA family protein [Pedobacter sandarakinus]
MKLSRQEILDFFRKSENRATVLLKDKKKANSAIKEALGKAVSNRGDLDGIWNKMQVLFSIAKDYINGEYTEIPKRSIVAILGGLLYFLSPIDVVPDFIPLLGFVDDIFVLNLVYKQVLKDLEKYNAWKASKMITLNGTTS